MRVEIFTYVKYRPSFTFIFIFFLPKKWLKNCHWWGLNQCVWEYTRSSFAAAGFLRIRKSSSYSFKPHILLFNGLPLELQFLKCIDPKLNPKWTFACKTERILSLERYYRNRQITFQLSYHKCSMFKRKLQLVLRYHVPNRSKYPKSFAYHILFYVLSV